MSKNKKHHGGYFTPKMLAYRWNISVDTLQRWRIANDGPRYVKVGGRVKYKIADIIKYEKSRTYYGTSCRANPDE
jgi:hypothetical protein